MHAVKLLHSWLTESAPDMHQVRLRSFLSAVESVAHGASLTVTSLGRGLPGPIFDKHKIKRMDRLLSNKHLFKERKLIYSTLTQLALTGVTTPLIVIDWSPLCGDLSHQLLRAAIPVGGRALTLYEEVHPEEHLGNRLIQHRFIDQLASILPKNCVPIIVADSGFRTPFYRYLEDQHGWHWIGRIRGRDFIRPSDQSKEWTSVKTLYETAKRKARPYGNMDWVRNNPLKAMITVVRNSKKNRHNLTLRGEKSRSRHNAVQAKRNSEPWVIVYSTSLSHFDHEQIIDMYRKRMQIELGFRDSKSERYGLGMCQCQAVSLERRAILCLIAACSAWLLWCIGSVAKQAGYMRQIQVNSSSKRNAYSALFLARLLLSRKAITINQTQIRMALEQVKKIVQCTLT